MTIPGNFMTSGMGVLPHTDLEKGLALAMSVDIPFWPQLPKMRYEEDMYAQVAHRFPGSIINLEKRKIEFNQTTFYEDLETYLFKVDDPHFFQLTPEASLAFHLFLEKDLAAYPAIRGQMEGPISFGLVVHDENDKPILYIDEVRQILFDFVARKVNSQLDQLEKKNQNVFMFIDEPGLQFIFSALSGYGDSQAKDEMNAMFSQIRGKRGIHLCGNPGWDFLLDLDIDILSFNAYDRGDVFVGYAKRIKTFLEKGGIIAWGLVPVVYEDFNKEGFDTLYQKIVGILNMLAEKGIDRGLIRERSLLMPATCSLVNPDGHATVENAYRLLTEIAGKLKESYR